MRDLEQDHGLQRDAMTARHVVGGRRLRDGAGEAVEHETARRVGPRTSSATIVITRSSAMRSPRLIASRPCARPSRGAGADMGAEQLAARQVGHVVTRRQPLALGPFPRARWAEHQRPQAVDRHVSSAKTAAQSFLTLTTVQPASAACSRALSAPVA